MREGEKSMDRKMFEETMNDWCINFRRPMNDKQAAFYWQRLKHIPDNAWKEIADMIILEGEHFPKIKDVTQRWYHWQSVNTPSQIVFKQTPCNACHEPHGVSVTQGNSMNNSHLINFDTSIVSPNSSALLQFVDNGDKAGSCDLLCHGKEHNNLEYQP